jgi:hypothetical protein
MGWRLERGRARKANEWWRGPIGERPTPSEKIGLAPLLIAGVWVLMELVNRLP